MGIKWNCRDNNKSWAEDDFMFFDIVMSTANAQ